MRIWRLTRPEYSNALDGEGSRLNGGRWNSVGVPMIYCASSLSLAVLEYFVNIPANMRRPGKLPALRAIGLDVRDELAENLKTGDYLIGLGMRECQAAGDIWARNGRSLGLIVPSAVIRRENNVLLNALHPRMSDVKIMINEPFVLDERLSN